jgi:ketosteroid isomerase-like protein
MLTLQKQSTNIPAALFATYIQEQGIKLSASDKLELVEKTQLFELALDARRFDAIEAFVTDDFIYDHALAYREGKKAHTEFWEASQAVLLDGIRHQPVNIIVYGEADGTATSVSALLCVEIC